MEMNAEQRKMIQDRIKSDLDLIYKEREMIFKNIFRECIVAIHSMRNATRRLEWEIGKFL